LGQKCSAYSFVKVAHSLLSLFAPAISHWVVDFIFSNLSDLPFEHVNLGCL
jgi:hypothetical protein